MQAKPPPRARDAPGQSDPTRLHAVMTSWRLVRKGNAIFRTGDPFDSIYALRAGSAKTVVAGVDGRAHVNGYYLQGDILWLGGISTQSHQCDATALEDCVAGYISFSELEALCRQVHPLQQEIHRLLSTEIVRESTRLMQLGGHGAEQHVARFLLDVRGRLEARGLAGADFHLRLTREDIGSYLGLTLETVSRTFSRLQQERLIALRGKHVFLIDIDGLEGLWRCPQRHCVSSRSRRGACL
ncbi:helix-turn-helix domain-containing protein [Cupriavidus sp. H39]|uniref:helix-turn-helix domain-containing protein n=1 Tax=Cupriavidus sp. H39 TaxID=3401635 RepID=UPI003D003FF5